MNISMILDMAADGFGSRVAVGPRQGGLTYAVVREQAQRVAAALTAHSVERLVLAGVNTDALPVLLFGSAMAGLPFTSVNYRLADDRLRDALMRCVPAVVVADEATARRTQGIPGLERLTVAELGSWTRDESAPVSSGEADEVAITLFTSGTSGAPKTVLLRHRNLVSYVFETSEFMSAAEDEAALVSVPPYHVAGMAAVLSNTYVGRRIVYLPQFEARTWVETARKEAVTHAMIVPTMLSRILDVIEESGTELPALRHLSYGGGRMPLPIIRRALELLKYVDFVNAYGLTETSSTICLLGPADHRAAFASRDEVMAARLGSVGRPISGVELEIRDPDGRRVAAGVAGEIVVRGEQVSGEYDGTDTKDAAGWFRTNDVGWLDQAGYLFIEGRADDVIVRGAENLSPGEIEDVLLQHPAVAEAAVVGMPDEEWGEAVAAFVVVDDGKSVETSELQQWVRERLRSSRMPACIEFRSSLPYSETGKLLRRELRSYLRQRTSA
jgi:fatty-acyl-CoA synthase